MGIVPDMGDMATFMSTAAHAFAERDADALIALTHPDAEIRLFANGRKVVHGREGAREIMTAAWSDPLYELSLDSFEEAGHGTVIGVGSVRRGTAGRSGFSQYTAAWLWTLEDGMIRTAEAFTSVEEARAAAAALRRTG